MRGETREEKAARFVRSNRNIRDGMHDLVARADSPRKKRFYAFMARWIDSIQRESAQKLAKIRKDR
jgi:hypothetical protein